MPDKRHHRGPHPADEHLFAADMHSALSIAVSELSWLLARGYATPSAIKLVGDRHALTERQRMAVIRCAAGDDAVRHRRATQLAPADCRGEPLGIDGYNLLITVESALSGGVVLVGRDGCYRDLASVHGTYRKVEETIPALTLIAAHVNRLGASRVDWYLDRPVSNSGRLRKVLDEVLDAVGGDARETWNVQLVDSPDRALRECAGVVATCDSAVLDACTRWTHLAGEIIRASVSDAWIVDLSNRDSAQQSEPPAPSGGPMH